MEWNRQFFDDVGEQLVLGGVSDQGAIHGMATIRSVRVQDFVLSFDFSVISEAPDEVPAYQRAAVLRLLLQSLGGFYWDDGAINLFFGVGGTIMIIPAKIQNWELDGGQLLILETGLDFTETHNARIEKKGNEINVYIDDTWMMLIKIASITSLDVKTKDGNEVTLPVGIPTPNSGYIGFFSHWAESHFDNVKITGN